MAGPARAGQGAWRAAHHRHRAPRKPAHRQPAARPLGPPGRPGREPLLPVAGRFADAHLCRRPRARHHGPAEDARGRGHRGRHRQRAASKARSARSRRATSTSASSCSNTTTSANDQRKVIYQQRNEILEATSLDEQIANLRKSAMTGVVRTYVPAESLEEQWDIAGLEKVLQGRMADRAGAAGRGRARATASPTRTSSTRWSPPPMRCSTASCRRWARSSSRPSCAWCCCSRWTAIGASTWRRWTTCARASTCAAMRRRTRSRNTSARPSSCSGQLLDVVKMEVTRLLMTVRIQSQEQVAQAAEEIEARASQVGNVTYTHPNEDGSVSTEAGQDAAVGRRRGAARAQGRPQRALPLRQRQEVQELPRQAGLMTGRCPSTTGATMPVNLAAPIRRAPCLPCPACDIGVAMAGVRKANRRDLTVVTLAEGSSVAGVFTANRFCAAPVLLCREHLAAGTRHPRHPGQHRQRQRRHRRRRPGARTLAPAPRWRRAWASRPSRCCRFPPA